MALVAGLTGARSDDCGGSPQHGRPLEGASAAPPLAGVQGIVRRPAADRRIELTLAGGISRPAFPKRPGTVALFALAQKICGELGTPILEATSRGGSDGSFAAALGVPTLDGLGPICHDSCSRRQTVELESIVPRGALLAGLIARLSAPYW